VPQFCSRHLAAETARFIGPFAECVGASSDVLKYRLDTLPLLELRIVMLVSKPGQFYERKSYFGLVFSPLKELKCSHVKNYPLLS